MELNFIVWMWSDDTLDDKARFRTTSREEAEKLVVEAEEAGISNSGVLEIPASYRGVWD